MFIQESRAGQRNERRLALISGPRQKRATDTPAFLFAVRSTTYDLSRQTALKQYLGSYFLTPRSPICDADGALTSLTMSDQLASNRARQSRVVVVDGISAGPLAFIVSLFRTLSRRTTFVVYFSEPPLKHSTRRTRHMLQIADTVIVDGHAASLALVEMGCAPHWIASTACLDRYLSIKLIQSRDQPRRVIVVSDLTPESGVYDLLTCLTTWSASHDAETIELHWVGDGDLSAMLAAQPHSDNLSQVFHGSLDTTKIASLFERGGLMAVSSVIDGARGYVAEALAAGLPVIGSRCCSEVRRHVTDDVTGWLFDPLTPGDLFAAVTRAFDTSPDRLVDMQLAARAAISQSGAETPHPGLEILSTAPYAA